MILRSVPQGSCSLWIICILIINTEDLPDSVPVLGFFSNELPITGASFKRRSSYRK